MKLIALNTIIASIVLVFSHVASAAEVQDARLNIETQTIEIDVTYSGGCEQHEFEVKTRNCTRDASMTCVVAVIDTVNNDQCRQIVKETIEVPAFEYIGQANLGDLVIVGDNGSAIHLPLR